MRGLLKHPCIRFREFRVLSVRALELLRNFGCRERLGLLFNRFIAVFFVLRSPTLLKRFLHAANDSWLARIDFLPMSPSSYLSLNGMSYHYILDISSRRSSWPCDVTDAVIFFVTCRRAYVRDNRKTPPLQKCVLRTIAFAWCKHAWQGSMAECRRLHSNKALEPQELHHAHCCNSGSQRLYRYFLVLRLGSNGTGVLRRRRRRRGLSS